MSGLYGNALCFEQKNDIFLTLIVIDVHKYSSVDRNEFRKCSILSFFHLLVKL